MAMVLAVSPRCGLAPSKAYAEIKRADRFAYLRRESLSFKISTKNGQ